MSQFYVDLDGAWWLLPADHRRGDLPPAAYDDPAALGGAGPFGAGDAAAGIAGGPAAAGRLRRPPRAVRGGRTIQAILEDAGLAYTGSGVAASAIGMDKPLFKRFARGAGLPVLDWVEMERAAWEDRPGAVLADLDRLAARRPTVGSSPSPPASARRSGWGSPTVPGSGRRSSRARLPTMRGPIVEPCLDRPRELEMGVLGNDRGAASTVLGPGEVVPGREFYDYADKYAAGSRARTNAAADVPAEVATEVRRVGAAAFALIGAAGFARVDFLLDRQSGAVALNEINTIPGFTPISLYPKVAEAAGLPFAELCARIVDLGAAARAARPIRRLAVGDLPR